MSGDPRRQGREGTAGPGQRWGVAAGLRGAGAPEAGPTPRGPGAATRGRAHPGAARQRRGEGDKGAQARHRDPAAAGQGGGPAPRSRPPPPARPGQGAWAAPRAPAAHDPAARPTAPSAQARRAAAGRPLNGSLFGSRQPGPRECRGAAGAARRRQRRGGHRRGRAGAKRSFTCRVLDVSEGDRPPRSGERALSDCGHLTRIPGRAAAANRNAFKGRCDQWAGAQRVAAQ